MVLTDIQFTKFRDLIYNASGIHFSSLNRAVLESRLNRRLIELKSLAIEKYYRQIISDDEEMKILLDTITINLTRFFRNEAHFKALEKYVIPELIEYKKSIGERTIKIWSAGCSTGEEPYSLAILFKDMLPRNFTYNITASDLSLKSLITAKKGLYSKQKIKKVPKKYLLRYFEEKLTDYLINEDIRNSIKFDYHNLNFNTDQRNFDIVFCRNVLIYFDEIAQTNVINKFYQAMNSHSYLFIGHSESLFKIDTKFEFLRTDHATMYRKFSN